MSNPNFIDTLPFKIELNANETKEYYFMENIKEFIVKFFNNLNITITLDNIVGDLNRDIYNSDIKINRKGYNRITFYNKNNIKTSIILNNLIEHS